MDKKKIDYRTKMLISRQSLCVIYFLFSTEPKNNLYKRKSPLENFPIFIDL